jgi:twitching motility protein PilT
MSEAQFKSGQQLEVKPPEQLKDIEKIMVAAAKHKASDLHIKAGQKPILRINTELHDVGNRALAADEIQKMIHEILTPKQTAALEEELGIDFAYSIQGVGRFRVNVYHDRGRLALAARRVNTSIPSFEDLKLPLALKRICDLDQGLVVVAGATGSGKSTTLACILDHINTTQRTHIVTVEDPIEYLFQDKNSLISQREIGIDVPTFARALKEVVREDPDIILLGEMRDHTSFDAALQAAETGHLVFTTIHASSASQTISRLLDLFPTERQKLIRQNLAFNLRAVMCQKLLPSCLQGVRMAPAVEILFNNPTATKLIMAEEDKKLQDLIRASQQEGMQDFNMSLMDLINAGLVSKKVAIQYSPNPEQLKMNLQGIYLSEQGIVG